MSTTTTTTTRNREDRYGPMEWAQLVVPYKPWPRCWAVRAAAVAAGAVYDSVSVRKKLCSDAAVMSWRRAIRSYYRIHERHTRATMAVRRPPVPRGDTITQRLFAHY